MNKGMNKQEEARSLSPVQVVPNKILGAVVPEKSSTKKFTHTHTQTRTYKRKRQKLYSPLAFLIAEATYTPGIRRIFVCRGYK